MTWYPQTANGCLVQLPLRRRTIWRAITNRFENGERVSVPDSNAGRIEWTLGYKDLSDDESSVLKAFFRSARGAFGAFSFVDPAANLFGWSDDPTFPDWQTGLLDITPGRIGPDGSFAGFTLTNLAGAPEHLSQTIALPGEYTTCFSVWLRSTSRPAPVTLRRGSRSTDVIATARWKRHFLSGPVPGEDAAPFSVAIQPGDAVDVSGLQVEAGPYPSTYKPTTDASGIYENTSFATDQLAITATGPGLSACEFTLISRF